MKFDDAFDVVKRHGTGITGAIIGAIVAILILNFGFLRVLFILVFAVIGYFAGNIIKHSGNWLKKLIDKILPPGTYR